MLTNHFNTTVNDFFASRVFGATELVVSSNQCTSSSQSTRTITFEHLYDSLTHKKRVTLGIYTFIGAFPSLYLLTGESNVQ